MNIVIEGLEYVEAPEIRTSKEIENKFKNTVEKFGLPENFIEDVSGVSIRREWPEEVEVSDIALLSAKRLLERMDIDRSEIGIIINPSVSRNYVEPAISVIVHDKLKLNDRCINFDINSACLGFANAVHIVSSLLINKQIKYGLIVCGESSKRVVNLTIDRLNNTNISLEDFMLEFATLTLGSGSVSMLLCREEDSKHKNHIIMEQMFSVDSKHNMLCKGDHNQMICNSHDMLKEGIFLVNKTWDICSKEFSEWNDKIGRFFPHQVSMTHTKVLSKYTGIDINKMELIFPYLGNIGPAAWPIALVVAEKEGRLFDNMNIGILSMGSGFNCSCLRIKW